MAGLTTVDPCTLAPDREKNDDDGFPYLLEIDFP